MAFYSSASNASLWRGINYYDSGKVRSFKHKDDNIIEGIVDGSEGREYSVSIDLNHPKKSSCNCPFADGRKVICKHMIALYFTSIPDSYELFTEDMHRLEVQYKLEEKRWQEETLDRIKANVAKLSVDEVREKLVALIYDSVMEDRYRDDRW